jgi:E3 ubiquitin-protein ligase HECTD1
LYLFTYLPIFNFTNRFVLDGKLATMYSSGSPEGGSDSSENRGEFLEKLQRARAAVTSTSATYPLFTKSCDDVIVVGNWNLSCKKDGELTINNSDGQQQVGIKPR